MIDRELTAQVTEMLEKAYDCNNFVIKCHFALVLCNDVMGLTAFKSYNALIRNITTIKTGEEKGYNAYRYIKNQYSDNSDKYAYFRFEDTGYATVLLIVDTIRHNEHFLGGFDTLMGDVDLLLPPTIDVVSGRKWKEYRDTGNVPLWSFIEIIV